VGMPLAPVADDRDRLPLEQLRITILLVIDFHSFLRALSVLCGEFMLSARNRGMS